MNHLSPSPAPSPASRRGWLDALKGFGILLVVFGHFMEQYRLSNTFAGSVFTCVYLFHMALFCVCSGLVARWNPLKLLTQQIWLYLVFQGVMLLFRLFFLREELAAADFLEALLLPWRHMWYLYALLLWSLTLPLLLLLRERLGLWGALAGFALALTVGLAGGLFDLPFILERVFAFYPFYAFGVLFSPWLTALADAAAASTTLRRSAAAVFAAGYGLCFALLYTGRLDRGGTARLFHDVPYGENYAAPDRLTFYLIGLASCLPLVCLFARADGDSTLAVLGRRTLPIYLLHLPILAALIEVGLYEPLRGGATLPIVGFVTLVSLGCLALLGSAPMAALFGRLANVWYDLARKK